MSNNNSKVEQQVEIPNYTKKLADNVTVAIAPFSKALGANLDKISNDIRALLGKVNKDCKMTEGEWKAGASFKLTRKNGETIQLPPNSPASILLCFGMRLNELAKAGKFEVQAEIPSTCAEWVQQHSIDRKSGEPVNTAQ